MFYLYSLLGSVVIMDLIQTYRQDDKLGHLGKPLLNLNTLSHPCGE